MGGEPVADASATPARPPATTYSKSSRSGWRPIADLIALRATVAALHDHATTVEPSTCAPAPVCRYL